MPDDRKPGSRFAAVALELEAEDNPSLLAPKSNPLAELLEVVERDEIRVAFQPAYITSIAQKPIRPTVTVALNDVVYRVRQGPTDDIVFNNWTLSAPPPRYLSKVYVDEVNDLYMSQDHPALKGLIRTMMTILQIEDFDAYAAQMRAENMARDRRPGDSLHEQRRTGRTWRGIVELMARHRLATTCPDVLVLGGSKRIDDWLRGEVAIIRDRLGNKHPRRISTVPDVAELIQRELKPWPGTMLLVDHTFYERRDYVDRRR